MDNPELPKHTPQQTRSRSTAKKAIDQVLANNLTSPFTDNLTVNLWPSATPLKRQPQYLLSPSPIKKDLFSQLLAHDNHAATPPKAEYIIEENSQSEEISLSQSGDEDRVSEGIEASYDNEQCSSDQNDIRKRRRKSTAQIKILKQHLNGQMNWTKQKICRMAQITGLSQSQVYKWCWDQKKKQNKHYEENNLEKSKIIRKNFGLRNSLHELNRVHTQKLQQKGHYLSKNLFEAEGSENEAQTKPKIGISLQVEKSTERKLKRRLVFN